MTSLLEAVVGLAVAAVLLIVFLRRNDRRVERDDPTINASGGPGFDDDDHQRHAAFGRHRRSS